VQKPDGISESGIGGLVVAQALVGGRAQQQDGSQCPEAVTLAQPDAVVGGDQDLAVLAEPEERGRALHIETHGVLPRRVLPIEQGQGPAGLAPGDECRRVVSDQEVAQEGGTDSASAPWVTARIAGIPSPGRPSATAAADSASAASASPVGSGPEARRRVASPARVVVSSCAAQSRIWPSVSE